MAEVRDKLAAELEQMREEDEKQAALKAESGEGGESHRRRRRHHRHHHSDPKSRKRRRRKRKIRKIKKALSRTLIITGIVLLLAVAVIATVVFTMRHSGKQELIAEEIDIKAPASLDVKLGTKGEYVIYNGQRYNFNKDMICILFLGVDKPDSDADGKQIGENHQSDMIALCGIDRENKKISIINVPRDIITDVNVYSPSGGYVGMEKLPIGTAYAYGDGMKSSCINSSEAVSRLFYNLPITTYFSLNLDGIGEVNDSVGGVDVKSPENIAEFEEGQTYHLTGDMATDFVRMRAKDRADANLLRNERQKIYLNAILQKFFKATRSDVSVPVNIYNAVKPYSCTNLNPDRITYLATEFIVNRDMAIQFKSVPVTVTQVENHAENYVKEKEFYELFLSIFYTKAK